MKLILKSTLILFLILPSVSYSQKSNPIKDDREAQEHLIDMMVTAKATGMCGVFSQLVQFQETTKMPGGDEFIVRFIKTEATRLGYDSIDDFLKICPKITQKYNENMKLLSAD